MLTLCEDHGDSRGDPHGDSHELTLTTGNKGGL